MPAIAAGAVAAAAGALDSIVIGGVGVGEGTGTDDDAVALAAGALFGVGFAVALGRGAGFAGVMVMPGIGPMVIPGIGAIVGWADGAAAARLGTSAMPATIQLRTAGREARQRMVLRIRIYYTM